MHKALYRTYRPQTFGDMVGQVHVIRTLKNQIKNDNIGHAYLFTGTRGTGKTSTAKIFARAVNCLEKVDSEPCNKCESCVSILNDSTMDVVEIDAASNNSVDDIRELRESVKYSPATSKYKVYIIDEVHMLSKGAFNALLKTLEEPPSYVIFILATTEPNKIPATILSRCQRFDFKRVSVVDMVDRMKKICSSEGIDADEKALQLIATNSEGAMRDALSILDQCMSFGEDIIHYEDVVEIMGTVNIEQLFDMSKYVIENDIRSSLQSLNSFISWGKDIRNLINDLLGHFRNLMICKVSKDMKDILEIPDDILDKLNAQAQGVDINTLIRILNVLSETQDRVKSSTNPRVLLEIAIMRISEPTFDESKEALIDRIENLEKIIESGTLKVEMVDSPLNYGISFETAQGMPAVGALGAGISGRNGDMSGSLGGGNYIQDTMSGQINGVSGVNPQKNTVKYDEMDNEDGKLVEESWKDILKQIKKDKRMPIYALLTEAKKFLVHENTLYIVFNDNFAFAKDRLTSEATHEYVENVINKIMKKKYSIKIELTSDVKNVKFEKVAEKDRGLEILEEIVEEGIIEVKDKIDKNN
ncbi:MAG: DNA polymerase III subunit gamma/tau [Clostridioides sp.]|jgi:DNA polymerase-3 subunit gamma/tau|nr:DNA polymerase III subunit gamma/tau [Clostridioides sp.]